MHDSFFLRSLREDFAFFALKKLNRKERKAKTQGGQKNS